VNSKEIQTTSLENMTHHGNTRRMKRQKLSCNVLIILFMIFSVPGIFIPQSDPIDTNEVRVPVNVVIN